MVICIIISATSIGFAAPINDINGELKTYSFEEIRKMPGSTVVNEFDAIESEEEILDFKIKLSELSKENKISLMNEGIHPERIQVIKSLENIPPENITDNQARLAAALMTFRLTPNYRNSTEASVSCYWAWDSAPLSAYQDLLTFAWTAGYTLNTTSRSTMTVNYQDINGNTLGSKKFSPVGSISGGFFKFGQSYYSPGIRGISSGSAIVVMDNDDAKTYIEVVASYGHTKLNIIPRFSVTWPSINFVSGMDQMGYSYKKF